MFNLQKEKFFYVPSIPKRNQNRKFHLRSASDARVKENLLFLRTIAFLRPPHREPIFTLIYCLSFI